MRTRRPSQTSMFYGETSPLDDTERGAPPNAGDGLAEQIGGLVVGHDGMDQSRRRAVVVAEVLEEQLAT